MMLCRVWLLFSVALVGCSREVKDPDDTDPIGTDCNIDEASSWYLDNDADSYGDPYQELVACEQPDGYAAEGGDCNDDDPNIYPTAIEVVGDGIDQDCDGGDSCWFDADDDGYTSSNTVVDDNLDCDDDSSLQTASIDEGDCDDDKVEVNPGAEEICDGLDNDCDGLVDDEDNDVIGADWFVDADNDGAGDSLGTALCDNPGGYVENDYDCDDSDSTIFPNATEACDGLLNDCNATELPEDEVDNDNDTFVECDNWTGPSSLTGGDCDDSDQDINPAENEIPG
ncbi:MAG: hypothetical protein HN348_09675, partial [Proteobacteria bacterium]|nr:hypothetical protein [Pseudomonadota bacterium]